MTATPAIHWRAFSLHKDGNAPEEYEDAFAGNLKSGRFAVADGATESSFARLWAELLVEGFVATREVRTAVGWLPPLQRSWAAAVDRLDLDWFGEEKRRLGAFATFLGLSLKKPQEGRDGRWKAVAVGDCCIFQVREDRLLGAFPVSRSMDFGNRPALLGARSSANGHDDPLARAKQKIGRWQAGDRFFLMTDAAAQWFLRHDEEQRKPWQSVLSRLAEPNGTDALTAYVEQLRREDVLKNDDITLLVIDL
jgi:hypothetical protein